MAEYAGLEIRIGGNTTSLNKALTASTKSAAELQSRIRQITRAMQFDPTNLSNVDTRIRITGDRMQSLQSKVRLTKTAMDQLGDSIVRLDGEAMTVRDVASQTDNLSLSAKQADERFVRLRDSLATVYETWNRAARAKGVDFLRDQMGIDAKTAGELMSTKTSLDTLLTELREIQKARKDSISGESFISNEDIETISQLKQLNFHGMFDEGLDLDELVQQATQLGIVIDDDVVEAVRNMRTEFVGAQQDKQAFDKALQFDQMGVDIQRLDSEVVSLSNDMRRLDDGMTEATRSEPFQQLEERLRNVDAALDNVNEDLERTEAALKLDPDNIELAVRRFDDLRQANELSQERMAILQEQMDMLDSHGASEAAASHRDLAKWIEDSAEAARNARIQYSDQQAAVANLDDGVQRLEQHVAMLGNNRSSVAMTENVQTWLTKTSELDAATQRVQTRMQGLEEAKGNLSRLEGELSRAREEVDRFDEALSGLYSARNEAQASFDEAYLVGDIDMMSSVESYISMLDQQIVQYEEDAGRARREVNEFTRAVSDQNERVSLAESTLTEAQTQATALADAVQRLEGTREVHAFKDFPEELERSKTELEAMQTELREARIEESRLESAYKAAESENELAKSANKVRELGTELADTRNKADAASEAMKGIDIGSVITPSTLKSIGMTMSATVTPFITGIGYGMLEASKTVDAAYRDMRKTVDGTEEQFERLRQSAIDFSRTHVTSADQILQIEAIGGELGIATEDLETFAEVISNIDVATNLDTEGAAEALGHLANIMHLSEDDFVGFSDALVRLGNNGASTESEIANIAERIGSMGSIIGMSASDVLAWSSSIASTGQNAEAAGTAISKTMSFFETAVAAAGGTMDTSFEAIERAVQEGGSSLVIFSNLMETTAEQFAEDWETDQDSVFQGVTEAVLEAKESLQGIADVAHMTAEDFSKAWENDPTSVMQAFIKGLNEIEESGGSADAVLQGFGITSVRQKQAIEGLMQTIDGLDDNLRMSEDAWNGVSDQWGKAGDAANEAQKKAEGFSGQMQILKNIGQIALSELGEGAVPYIQMLSGSIENLSTWFSNIGTNAKTAIVGIGGFAALLGPVLTMVSTGMTAFGNISDWMDEAVNATALVKTVFRSGGEEAVKALTGSMTAMQKFKVVAADMGTSLLSGLQAGAVVAAIVAIGLVLKKLYDDWKTHVKATEGLSSALSGIGRSASDASVGIDSEYASLQRLMQESEGYEDRLANLAGTIEESNEQYSAYAGKMEHYADVIKDLGGRSDLTREEMSKLSAAVSAVNDELGTTYGFDEFGRLIDTSTGKVMANTDALLANIDARKNQALIDYYADDYAEATENWAAAQARTIELQEEYDKLTSTSGREQWIQNYIDTVGRADLAEEAYQNTVDQTSIALANSKDELARTETAMSDLEAHMDIARIKMDSANRTLDEANRKQEEYGSRVDRVTKDATGNMSRLSAAVGEAGKDDGAFNAIAAGLDSIHVYARELDNVDMASLVSAFDGVDGSMEKVIATLEKAGVSTKTWHAALDQAPEAAERMGSLSAAAFDSLYQVAGQDLTATMELIAGLDEMQVGEKTFFLGDDGTIMDEQGRIYDLQKDLKSIPDEVITKLTGEDTDLRNKLIEDKRKLDELDATVATPTVNINDYATARIDYINQRLNELGNKRTNTVITATTQATGGMNSRPVIPRHATGYIATGPTLTNQGWIGEDGVEAVANWATGGAVVPLTNKRYMLPIADAIASGMEARGIGSGGTTIQVNLNYTAGDDANTMARDLARSIGRIMDTRR